jgi:hypothetical protein
MCLARTDWGLTWFAVPCDAPGLTIHGPERMAPDAEVSRAGIAARKSYLRRAVRTI